MNSRILLVLHSHIPYVKRQGRWPFGEVWLFEAMAETYIPLIQSWMHLRGAGVNNALSFSFSPILLEQLSSKYIQQEFISYLQEREARAVEDERYYMSRGEKNIAGMASFYRRFYRDTRRDFVVDFGRDIVGAIKKIQDEGQVEVITTAATHAYLPLLDANGLEHQVLWGKKMYEHYFHREPQGFWLPECGYFHGIEDILIANGFKYFYVDSHGVEGGKPIEVFSGEEGKAEVEIATFARTGLSTYRPYRIKDKDITVYGRNSMVSHQVWSADYGYPGDANYREFHKQDSRSGFKYWKVTDRRTLDHKQIYDPEEATRRAQQHAVHFVKSLEDNSREARKLGFAHPSIVGCYDTELFGHWWWEGVRWLEEVIKEIDRSSELELALPYDIGPAKHEAQVFESSWGMGGKHFVWDNNETTWMWEIIKKAGQEYEALKIFADNSEMHKRAVCQALKELMLIQSSDWLFMVSNNLTRDYAMKRFFEHYTKLLRLSNCLRNNKIDEEFGQWLQRIQYEDDFFNIMTPGGVI